MHKNNYSQFQKGQLKQGTGSASGNFAPPSGAESRQHSVEQLAESQVQSISVLSSDAFGQIYQTQQTAGKRHTQQLARGPQHFPSNNEMQLRQAYGPPGKAQKAGTSKGKGASTVAPNKSRRILV